MEFGLGTGLVWRESVTNRAHVMESLMNEVINFPVRNERIEMADDSGTEHPYRTMLTRRYRTRDEAFAYLASRGFLFLPSGWKNGRWMATIEPTPHDFFVAIRLPGTAA